MKRTLSVLALGASCMGLAQPVGPGVWHGYSLGPSGATDVALQDIDWSSGNAGQNNLYTVGRYVASGRSSNTTNEYTKAGDGLTGALLATADSQHVSGGKVLGQPTGAVYFGGALRPTASGPGNIILLQRGVNLAPGWSRILDVATGADDMLTHLAAEPVGSFPSVFVAGVSRLAGVNRWFIAKYASNGTFQFVRVGENNSIPTGLVADATGNVYVSYALTVAGVQQSRLVKYNASGTFQWRTGYNPTTTNDVSFADIAFANGRVFGVGYVRASASKLRPMVAAFDGTGARVASEVQTTINGFFRKALPLSDGRFYAVGTQSDAGAGVISSLYNPALGSAAVWNRKATPGPTSVPATFDATTDAWNNLYFAANSSRSDATGRGLFLGKYNPGGTSQWTYSHFTPMETREGAAITLHPSTGQLWVAGRHLYSSFQLAFHASYTQAPVAIGETFANRPVNSAMNANVWANDRYYDGGTYTLVSGPASGSLTLETDGDFSYTPATGFIGDAVFRYKIVRTGVSESATVTVTIPYRA